MYKKALELAGYEVNHVTKAQEGISAADSKRPDLVMLELNLHGHNGVEFMYEFRSYHDWLNVPIMVVSHTPFSALNVAELVWEQLGVVNYHYKPEVSLKQLVHSVTQALS
jgi:two-component system KDP operon response regulator KdpE